MTLTDRTAPPPSLSTRSAAGRLIAPVAVAVAALAVTATIAAVDPNEPGHYPTCPFLQFTGLYCPGCGTLRAVHALAHGDLGTAVARNPLTVVALPLLVWGWVLWLRTRLTGRRSQFVLPAAMIWGWLGVVLSYWVLRNLPGMDILAP